MGEPVTSTQSTQAFRITARYNSLHAYRCYVRAGNSVWDTMRYADKHWVKFHNNCHLNLPRTCRMGISHHGRSCRIKVTVSAMNSAEHNSKWFRVSEDITVSVPCGSFAQLHLDIGNCKLETFDCISIALRAVDDNQKIRLRLCGVDWGIRSPIHCPPTFLHQHQMEFLGRCDLPRPVLQADNGHVVSCIGFETPNMHTQECESMVLDASTEDGSVCLTYDMGHTYPCATYMVLTTPRCDGIDLLAYAPLNITLSTSDTGTGWDVIYRQDDGPMWCSDGEEQRVYSFPPSQAYISPRFYRLSMSGMLMHKLMLAQFGLAVCGRTTARVQPLRNYLMYDMTNSHEYTCDNLVRSGERLRVPAGDTIISEFNMGDEVLVGAVRFVAMLESHNAGVHDEHIGKMDISVCTGPPLVWTSVCSSMIFSSKFETTIALSQSVDGARWKVRIHNTCGAPFSVCGPVLLDIQCGGWNERKQCEQNKFMSDMNLVKTILTQPKTRGPFTNMPMTMLILTLSSLCKSKNEFIESLQSITKKGIMCSDGASIGSTSDETTHPLIHWIPSEIGRKNDGGVYASNDRLTRDVSETVVETAHVPAIAPTPPGEAEYPFPVHSCHLQPESHPHAPCPAQQHPPPIGFDALQMRKETPLYQEHNGINERLTYYDSLLDMELKSSITSPPPRIVTGPCNSETIQDI